MTVLFALLQALVLFAVAPLLSGITRVLARLHNRRGPGVMQEYRDIIKLLGRQSIGPDASGWVFRLTPFVMVGVMLTIATALPVVTVASPLPGLGDLITLIYLFAVARFFFAIAGLDTGSYWMARAGLLSGYRATLHWQEINRFSDDFPDVIVSSNLYEIDRNRGSCAGGAATLDFMLALIGQQLGSDFTAQLSEVFSIERVRPGNERQRIPLQTRIGGSQPKLTEAVSLMEANIEEPLTTDDIAFYVGVSRRQLERLFKQHLNTVPSKYYLELRLNRARQLLQQTSKSIVQIGLSCGFSSGPHFSSTYRNHFGMTPREERAQRGQQS